MSPLGVSCELPENESSSSPRVDSSAGSSSENAMLSSVSSTSSAPGHSLIKSESSQETVSETGKLETSLSNFSNGVCEVLPQLDKNTTSPVKQVLANSHLNSCSNGLTNTLTHLALRQHETSEPVYKKPSTMRNVPQHVLDYINSNIVNGLNGESRFDSPSLFEPSAEKPKDDLSGLKVVVQAMPLIHFGHISALQQCISDSSICRKSRNNFGSGSNETCSTKRHFESGRSSTSASMKIPPVAPSRLNETQDTEDADSNHPSKEVTKDHRLNSHIQPGRGMKLADIKYISSALSDVKFSTLQTVHHLLFGTYEDETCIDKTKANILNFSGFPFNEFSEEYKNKCKSLMKLPFTKLFDIYVLLVRRESNHPSTMVRQLLQFCLKPVQREVPSQSSSIWAHQQKLLSELKNRILKAPPPVVLLERLSERIIKRMTNGREIRDDEDRAYAQDFKRYARPSYIERGPGQKLKFFPNVAFEVNRARRRIINLLHTFLYGLSGSDSTNRLNILEFSGFLQYDKFFLQRKFSIINRFKKVEFEKICDIFSIPVICGNKVKTIERLLYFLQAPSIIVNSRRSDKVLPLQAERQSTQKLKVPANALIIKPPGPRATKLRGLKKELVTKSAEPRVPKLRDIEKVCHNIECAPPGDLAELHDILFIKPCDISEIHEKILNFTPFPFYEDSFEFHCRKTLMHYMSPEIIKKVARILEIPFSEEHLCQQNLAMTILKFLMNLKLPDNVLKTEGVPLQKKRGRKRSAPSQICRPHILKVQKKLENQEAHGCSESSASGKSDSIQTLDRLHEKDDNSDSTIVIKRISDSSYSWTDLQNGPLTISNLNSDEALSLSEFARHPTENHLELTIKEVICSNSWSITTGDLLNKVLHHYPKYNLMYRCEFIKAKALEIIHEMQECSMDSTLDNTV